MTISIKKWLSIALFGCLLVVVAMLVPAHAESLVLSDTALEGIEAKGDISVGSFSFSDNHQFDASQYKGSIHMDGYVQQNVIAEINLNQTQSAAATGVNVIGNINSAAGQTISQSNANTATSFVGGF